MEIKENGAPVPLKMLGTVPQFDELHKQITSRFQLDETSLVLEKVFMGTHRITAVDASAKRYVDAPVHHTIIGREQQLFDVLEPQLIWLKRLFPTAKPLLIQVASIPPGKQLLWHIDSYIYQSLSHKVHLPIISNLHAAYEYMIGRRHEKIHLQPGKAYEINNIMLHRASNYGTEPRVHVIVDLLEEEGYKLLEDGVDIVFTHHPENKLKEQSYSYEA